MDLENNFDFYATRDEKVETLLNQEYDDWNFRTVKNILVKSCFICFNPL